MEGEASLSVSNLNLSTVELERFQFFAGFKGWRLYKRILKELRDADTDANNSAEWLLVTLPSGAKMSSQPVSLHVESGVISGDDIVRENSDEKKIEEFSVPTTPVKPEVAERPISGDGTIRRSQSWCGLSSRGDASPSRIEVDESKLKSEEELDSALQFSKLVEILERHKDEPSTEEGATADTRQIRSCPWLSARSKMYRQVEKNYFYKRRNPTHPYGENSFGRLPKQSARHEALLPEVPAQPTLEKIRAIYRQEKQKKERQRAMALQQTMLQNLRDADKIRKWRQNYVRMQKDQIAEFLGKTQKEIREEANQRILSGPLDVTRDDLKVLGSNELNNIRQRSIQSARRPSNLDPETVLQLELAGMERDSRLRDQVQRHMKDVAKRFQVPLPQTHEALKIELLTAKRDLDEVRQTHGRVELATKFAIRKSTFLWIT
ncbi:unnamed protein product [Calicophoron daubneyi]|uniref:Uncharacterized protein n=1 Tax=Calicophoron daubneyi TaxID=300641 RepID=A0AAV2TPI5_CALDB